MRNLALRIGAVALGAAALLAETPGVADVVSNTYLFKQEVVLRTGLEGPAGLRVESVRFGTVRLVRSSRVAAQVVVSNPGDAAVEAGVALALLDAQGRLVGAAAAGPGRVRPSQIRVFNLAFQGVEQASAAAVTFQVSLEVPVVPGSVPAP